MLRIVPLAIVVTLALSGCASTTGTFFNRPVVEDRVGETLHTVSLSADRRTVIVARPGFDTPKFCAEPPPDTATAFKTDLDATLKAKGNELSVKDKLESTVTVLASRNAPLDAFRTGMFALCQFYMNGAIDRAQVPIMFTELLKVFKDTQNLTVAVTKPIGATTGQTAGGTTTGTTAGAVATGTGTTTTTETHKAGK